MTLQENQRAARLMRAATDEHERRHIREWMEWLQALGDGELNDEDDTVEIWPVHRKCCSSAEDIDAMLQSVYNVADDELLNQQPTFWAKRSVLAPKHSAVDYVNARMLQRLPGTAQTLYSSDMLDRSCSHMDVDVDFLNRQCAGHLPPHELVVKVGALVMITVNLDKRRGMVNGTRVLLTTVSQRLLRGTIITTGDHFGKEVVMCRIRLKPRNSRLYPFLWTRIQFPVKICWAMTANKSQGQTLERVALLLGMPVLSDNGAMVRMEPLPCFGHGQLVVALTRVGHPDNVSVYMHPDEWRRGRTVNVLLREALLRADDEEDVSYVTDGDILAMPPLRAATHTQGYEVDDRPVSVDDLLDFEAFDQMNAIRQANAVAWLRHLLLLIGYDQVGDALPTHELSVEQLLLLIQDHTGAQLESTDVISHTIDELASALVRQLVQPQAGQPTANMGCVFDDAVDGASMFDDGAVIGNAIPFNAAPLSVSVAELQAAYNGETEWTHCDVDDEVDTTMLQERTAAWDALERIGDDEGLTIQAGEDLLESADGRRMVIENAGQVSSLQELEELMRDGDDMSFLLPEVGEA